MYAIVDTQSRQVVPQKGTTSLVFTSLSRVDLPDGTAVFNPAPGYEFGVYKLFSIVIDKSGAGSIVSDGAPVYDGTSVVMTRTLSNPPTTVVSVRNEAERRIATGILVNSKPFRCDEASVSRISRILDAFARNLVGADGVTFKTAGGDTFILKTAAQAQAIYDAQIQWQAAILARSAQHQDNLPADIAADANWPAQTTVTLP